MFLVHSARSAPVIVYDGYVNNYLPCGLHNSGIVNFVWSLR